MNESRAEGESSCKRQENGDGSSSERPLKKARFAWQVKGKYHLRNEHPENKKPTAASGHDPTQASSSSDSESDSNDLVTSTEHNLEILGDYLLKQDFNTLDTVITNCDKSITKTGSTVAPGKLSYSRYTTNYVSSITSTHEDSNKNLSVPMAVAHQIHEDYCITRWQNRQMAQGIVDNTINRVLDSWMVAPLPADMVTNRFLALDVAEFSNNLPGDNSIENEGILMAISAHGLQNTSSRSSENLDNKPPEPKEHSSPAPHNESWNKPFTCSVDTSGSSSEAEENKANYFDDNMSMNDDAFANHYDFMDAAICIAIQNKGLASYGTDYG